MKRKLTAGLTSATFPIFVQDTSSTTGGGLSGLVFNTASLVAEYRRQGQSTWTAVTLVAGTLGTWSSGGFVADGALAGAYEVGLPDAALASGSRWVAVRLRGATNMLPCLIEIELDLVNYQDAVRFGLTALPNVASGSAGAIPTTGSGANQISVSSGSVTLTTGERDSIAAALLDLANGVETSVTVRQSLRAIAAMLAGNVTGAQTASELFRAIGNAGTTRITNAGDASGNRTITTNL